MTQEASMVNWGGEVQPVNAAQPPAAPMPQTTPGGLGRVTLDMSNPMSLEATLNPMTNAENYHASLKSLLARNVGSYVVATFHLGTPQAVVWQGILHTVGNDYIVLYQPDRGRYISGDLYALKFVEFHDPRPMPQFAQPPHWN